jgi:hypothetical protein
MIESAKTLHRFEKKCEFFSEDVSDGKKDCFMSAFLNGGVE